MKITPLCFGLAAIAAGLMICRGAPSAVPVGHEPVLGGRQPDLAAMTSAGISLGEAIRTSQALTRTYLESPEFNSDAAELERITEKLDAEVFQKTVASHPELRESATRLYTQRLDALRHSFQERLQRQQALNDQPAVGGAAPTHAK